MLWNYDRRVLAILALFVFATICEPSRRSLSSVTLLIKLCLFPATGGADLGIYLHNTFKSSDQALQGGTGVKQGDARAAIMMGPTLATNVLSTVLIGIQAWWVVTLGMGFAFASSRDL